MGFVYVLETDDGSVKIGRSTDPERRIKEISAKVKKGISRFFVSIDLGNYGDIENSLLREYRDENSEGEWVSHPFDSVVSSAEYLIKEIGSVYNPKKTNVVVRIDKDIWKQFMGLAALKKLDRQKLLEEAIKDKILKEAGK